LCLVQDSNPVTPGVPAPLQTRLESVIINLEYSILEHTYASTYTHTYLHTQADLYIYTYKKYIGYVATHTHIYKNIYVYMKKDGEDQLDRSCEK
jgi:hypothetical protein